MQDKLHIICKESDFEILFVQRLRSLDSLFQQLLRCVLCIVLCKQPYKYVYSTLALNIKNGNTENWDFEQV